MSLVPGPPSVQASSPPRVPEVTPPASRLAPEVPDSPPPDLRYRRHLRLAEALRQLYRAAGLIRSLTERELRVRYKQAHLGAAWALLSPALLMVVFTLLIGRGVLSVGTGGKPAYLFSYVALVPWMFFATSLSQGGISLVTNLYLVNKIYCPREVFPLTSVLVAGFDALVASLLLLVLFPVGHSLPAGSTIWLPLLLLVEVIFTIGVTLFVSAVVVYFRDLRHLLPVIVQFGLFATPVMYTMTSQPGHRTTSPIPRSLLDLYSVINPLGPIIDSIRRVVLFGQSPEWSYVGIAAATSLAVLVVGYWTFKSLEAGIADVA